MTPFTPEEKRFIENAKAHFEKTGTIGIETQPDGSAEIAPGVWVTDDRLQLLMEYAL